MKLINFKSWFEDRNLSSLCFAAFMMSAALGIFLVALPFIVKRLGGSDGDVGLSVALNFFAYLAACMIGMVLLDRFNPKRILQVGVAGIVVSLVGLVLTVIFADKSRASIWILNLFSMLLGVLTAMYWPPLMGWVSRGYEGQGLSHRLGSFNMSWSSGSWISPYIGGLLVGVNSIYPMAAALIAGIGAMAGINLTSNPAKTSVTQAAADPAENVDEQNPNLVRFQWMARLALLVSFVAIGLMRSQLGLLFKFELGFSEAKYGLAITTMCFANFVTFWAMGRNHKWHYKVWPFILSQVFIALSLVMIIEFTSLGVMLAAAGVVGLSEAFIYTSHLFYGVSGGKRRLGLMAVHEFLLSSGIVIGSVVGGYISDGFGRYMPYWFGLWTVAAAIFAQAAIWYAVKPVKAVYANPDSEQK